MQGLGQSKKVQDIQKQLDMSLDDLIKSKPKKAAAGGAKPKQAPKLLVKPVRAWSSRRSWSGSCSCNFERRQQQRRDPQLSHGSRGFVHRQR